MSAFAAAAARVAIGTCALIGCGTSSVSSSFVLTNERFEVRVFGGLDDVGRSGSRVDNARVQFEARHVGGQVFALGALYEAGPHDLPFRAKYPFVEWVTPQALRFAARPSRSVPPLSIKIVNGSDAVIAWSLVSHQDLILALAMPPESELIVPSLRWGNPRLRVVGQFADGTAIPSNDLLVRDETRDVHITVGNHQTLIQIR